LTNGQKPVVDGYVNDDPKRRVVDDEQIHARWQSISPIAALICFEYKNKKNLCFMKSCAG